MSLRTFWPMPEPPHAAAARSAASAIVVVLLVIVHQRLLGALLDDVELDPAVLLLTLRGVVGRDRLVGPEPLRHHPLLLDPLAGEVGAHRAGALARELAV